VSGLVRTVTSLGAHIRMTKDQELAGVVEHRYNPYTKSAVSSAS
jgi:hypothetical protein